MIRKILKKTLKYFEGKLKYQNLFFKLFNYSLRGMNFGGSGKFNDSGELFVINYLEKKYITEKNIVIFDVGANTGEYSSAIINSFQKKINLFLFEPSKTTFSELKKCLTPPPSLSVNIKLFNFGLRESNGKRPLYSSSNKSGLTSTHNRRLDHFDVKMENTEIGEFKTLDNFCQENNIFHINFLKLDVEGDELAILKGANNMLDSGKIDYIQFEFGGCNIDSRSFFQDFFYLLNPKYKIFRIVNDGLCPICKYDEKWEIFSNTNYLAEKR